MELSVLGQAMLIQHPEVERCTALLERYGRRLTRSDVDRLQDTYRCALSDSGRIATGGSVLYPLTYAFCDSPFLEDETFTDSLCTLLELFCLLKTETKDALSDDELITAMAEVFNGPARGSVEWLEGMNGAEWVRWVMRK